MKYWIATKNDNIIAWFAGRKKVYAALNEKKSSCKYIYSVPFYL